MLALLFGFFFLFLAKLVEQPFDDVFCLARGRIEGEVRNDHRIFFDPGFFAFASSGFGLGGCRGIRPLPLQDAHPLAVGTQRNMAAFRLRKGRFDLLVEGLDILSKGQALTLRQLCKEGKVKDLVESVDRLAKILLGRRSLQPLQQQVRILMGGQVELGIDRIHSAPLGMGIRRTADRDRSKNGHIGRVQPLLVLHANAFFTQRRMAGFIARAR